MRQTFTHFPFCIGHRKGWVVWFGYVQSFSVSYLSFHNSVSVVRQISFFPLFERGLRACQSSRAGSDFLFGVFRCTIKVFVQKCVTTASRKSVISPNLNLNLDFVNQ